MEFNEYQDKTTEDAVFDEDVIPPVAFAALGLSGETGEVAEKIKKIFRNDKGEISDEKREDLKKELGDVLWYLAQLAQLLGIPLEDVAKANLDKLSSRLDRGVVNSEGDDR